MKLAKTQIPSYYEVPTRRVDGFVGREDILQRVDKALSESDGSGPRYAVLQGIGGQGKSQVALEYCRRKKENPYSAIFWVDATTETSVKGSLQSISECIKGETNYLPNIEARVVFVLKTLASWTVRWLIVLDNYDNPDTFLNIRDFVLQSELGAILVTSRHPDSNALVITQRNQFIELPGLEESAAVTLLVQESQTNDAISSDAKNIVERLGCHPLAITQAGAYIRKRKLRLSEFMDHYKRRKRIILESTPQLSQYRKKLGSAEEETSLNVFTTWELSFRQLQSEASEDSVDVKLLTLMAYFNEKDISEQLFVEFFANPEQRSEATSLLIWLNAFCSVEGQWNSDLFGDVLIRLRDSSLLQAFSRGPDKFYHASLHPLVIDWIILRTDISICQENTCMAGALVGGILENSLEIHHFNLPLITKQNINSHIIALEENYQDFFISQPDTLPSQYILDEYIRLRQTWFAKFLQLSGSYYLAEIIYQRLIAQNKKVLGIEHPVTLTTMAELAAIFLCQGRWTQAEDVGLEVMETQKRVLGLEHPDTLTSIANLALTYSYQGRLKEAEKLRLQVMETISRVLGPEHPDTLTSILNVATTYSNQGRLKEAEKLLVQVMETTSKVLGLDHPSTVTSMNNLASIFMEQGRLKEAEELQSQVIETNLRVLGPEHPNTLSTIANVATIYSNQGRLKEAEELNVQVMETRSKVLGLDHTDTLSSISNVALTFMIKVSGRRTRS